MTKKSPRYENVRSLTPKRSAIKTRQNHRLRNYCMKVSSQVMGSGSNSKNNELKHVMFESFFGIDWSFERPSGVAGKRLGSWVPDVTLISDRIYIEVIEPEAATLIRPAKKGNNHTTMVSLELQSSGGRDWNFSDCFQRFHLRVVFSTEGSTSVSSPSAVGVDDDLPSSQTGITLNHPFLILVRLCC